MSFQILLNLLHHTTKYLNVLDRLKSNKNLNRYTWLKINSWTMSLCCCPYLSFSLEVPPLLLFFYKKFLVGKVSNWIIVTPKVPILRALMRKEIASYVYCPLQSLQEGFLHMKKFNLIRAFQHSTYRNALLSADEHNLHLNIANKFSHWKYIFR